MNRRAALVIVFVTTGVACASSGPADRSDPAAHRAIASLALHPGVRALPAARATEIRASGNGFEYAADSMRALRISLPANAAGGTAFVRNEGSLRVTLVGARADSLGSVERGTAVYPDALGSGTHVFHRPLTAGGDEEVIYFESAPRSPQVTYGLEAGARIASFVVRSATVDALDERGRALFHMDRPVVIGADGKKHAVEVAARGCEERHVRASPIGGCALELHWPADVRYPALLDPAWTATGSLARARGDHSAVLLPDGRVLVSGGKGYDSVTNNLIVLSTAEVYSPVSGTWRTVGSMNQPRSNHVSKVLPDGRVLVSGGQDQSSVLASAEVFDPQAETWATVGSMGIARAGHDVIDGPNYDPMVVGGADAGGNALASAEAFDVTSLSWHPLASLNLARHHHRLAELSRGQIITISGQNALGWTPSIESYDSTAEQWTTFGALATARINHAATRLKDTRVLVTGGVAPSGAQVASAELIDPSGTVTGAPPMSTPRYGHTATLLQTGKVLVVGGQCDVLPCGETSEEYDPTLNAWDPPVSMGENAPRRFHSSTLLGGGHVLTTGGYDFTASSDLTISWSSIYDAAKCKPIGVGGIVIGKIAGAPSAGPSCRMMNTYGGGTPPPSAQECANARIAATVHAARFR